MPQQLSVIISRHVDLGSKTRQLLISTASIPLSLLGAMTSVQRCYRICKSRRSTIPGYVYDRRNFVQQRSFHAESRNYRFLSPNLLRNHGLIRNVTVISLSGLGLCTLSNQRPLKADSPRNDLSQDTIQETRRAVHSDAKEPPKNYSSNEPDFDSSGEQEPPPQTTSSEVNEQKDSNSWNDFTSKVSSIQWGSISDKIKNIVVPQWVSD
jgi:hypothetical protein